jgi:phosphosulfolactate synthase
MQLNLNLPARTEKPRSRGISNLVDNGYGLGNLEDVLSFCHPFVDIAKLGWASAYVTKNLREKVELYSSYDIRTCLGGMMFEICWWQNKVEEYHNFMCENGINTVEVSNGSLPIPESEKVAMIQYFVDKDYTVLSEVGSKDVTVESPPEYWMQCIKNDLAAGAWKVIVEGRADASAGIYTHDGNVKDDLVEAFLASDVPLEKLIFEAPHKRQVAFFVNRMGPNVNLGNIPLGEALNVETLRQGLRGDTVLACQAGLKNKHDART